ncbi:hypothetical protein HYPDE_38198 [Hyphomicrobium denitrificans 1NES1]|uniref:Uncharacterized protein n=1 Tax=Hyphomicrobium denitrificans 1NES1 TaxID=670307 RepID=N0BFR6_9HYPH|nr:hypothetical protein HYPDE_38198 [Hyphomicrobium denitrificans 1NES1]
MCQFPSARNLLVKPRFARKTKMSGDSILRVIIDSSGARTGAAQFNAAVRSMSTSSAVTARSVLLLVGFSSSARERAERLRAVRGYQWGTNHAQILGLL